MGILSKKQSVVDSNQLKQKDVDVHTRASPDDWRDAPAAQELLRSNPSSTLADYQSECERWWEAYRNPHEPSTCGLGQSTSRTHSDLCYDIRHELCDECVRARDARQHESDRQARRQGEREDCELDAELHERARMRDIETCLREATGISMAELARALLQYQAEPIAEIAQAVLEENKEAA